MTTKAYKLPSPANIPNDHSPLQDEPTLDASQAAALAMPPETTELLTKGYCKEAGLDERASKSLVNNTFRILLREASCAVVSL